MQAEAEKVTEQEWERLIRQPACEDVDLADYAEQAQEAGIDFYLTANGIQQGTTNMLAVALHHLHEQQLLLIHRRELLERFEENHERLLTVDEVRNRLMAQGVIDIKRLDSWDKINELRLVANVVKHTDGRSAEQLRSLRPDLFVPPGVSSDMGRAPGPRSQVFRPLIGEDLYVSVADLDDYFEAVEKFWYALAKGVI